MNAAQAGGVRRRPLRCEAGRGRRILRWRLLCLRLLRFFARCFLAAHTDPAGAALAGGGVTNEPNANAAMVISNQRVMRARISERPTRTHGRSSHADHDGGAQATTRKNRSPARACAWAALISWRAWLAGC